MSYDEYKDMYDKAQTTGLYHMFIFDIIGSRNYGKELEYIERTSSSLLYNVYMVLKSIESEENIKVLHEIENPVITLDIEPFKFGDLYGFTVLRGSIDREKVYRIFEEEKNKFNIYWDFHKKDGFYETDYWVEGREKYYRGYCMQQLEYLSKKIGNAQLKRNKRDDKQTHSSQR